MNQPVDKVCYRPHLASTYLMMELLSTAAVQMIHVFKKRDDLTSSMFGFGGSDSEIVAAEKITDVPVFLSNCMFHTFKIILCIFKQVITYYSHEDKTMVNLLMKMICPFERFREICISRKLKLDPPTINSRLCTRDYVLIISKSKQCVFCLWTLMFHAHSSVY